MKPTIRNKPNLAEFNRIPVSSQGQVTLPKPLREYLGLTNGVTGRIDFIIKNDGLIVIEPLPTAASLAGSLGPTQIPQVDVYEAREEITDERLRELGYCPQDH